MTSDGHPKRTHHLPALLVCGLIAFGCGERAYILDPGEIDSTTVQADLACFEGAKAELSRFSTACAKSSPKSVSSEVSEQREFPAEMVESLEAPCAEGPTPAIEVYFDRSSVVFDFVRVDGGDRFPQADFDGYILDLALTHENALLVGALIDRERTTLAVDADDITVESDRIEINMEGVAYDPESLLEIDLLFLDAPALPEDA